MRPRRRWPRAVPPCGRRRALILGGDNLDLALAHHLERRIAAGGNLSPRQWGVLVQTARRVKETLLAQARRNKWWSISPAAIEVVRRFFANRNHSTRACEVLVGGFLPRVGLEDKPQARRSGFQEFGPAVCSRCGHDPLSGGISHDPPACGRRSAGDTAGSHDPARPDIVLFNGGFFAAPLLRERLLEVLASWFSGNQAGQRWSPIVLKNERLDLAVARGAAYYGMVRRGQGTRISAGLARTYYIGVETDGQAQSAAPSAVCLVPAGVEEGQSIELESPQFHLWIRSRWSFPLYVSSTRLTDPPGTIVPFVPSR